MTGVPGGLPIHSTPAPDRGEGQGVPRLALPIDPLDLTLPQELKDELDRVYGKADVGRPVNKGTRRYGRQIQPPLPPGKGDAVTLPNHYSRYAIEPVHFCMENGLDPFQFNIIKYTARHDAKNGIEDLNKAKRYIEMYIKFLSGDPDWWR